MVGRVPQVPLLGTWESMTADLPMLTRCLADLLPRCLADLLTC
jgi:hypothetical protein